MNTVRENPFDHRKNKIPDAWTHPRKGIKDTPYDHKDDGQESVQDEKKDGDEQQEFLEAA